MPRLIDSWVVLPVAIFVEVWTAVFQLTVRLLLEVDEQFSFEGIVMVSELKVSEEFLLVKLRYEFVTTRFSELFERSCRFEADEVSEDGTTLKLEVTKYYFNPSVVPS